MKNTTILLVFIVSQLIFSSCNSSSDLKNKVNYEVRINKIDSSAYRDLSRSILAKWNKNIIALDSTENFEFYFKGLLKIDSLKKAKVYASYLEKLDIGQLADIGAYKVKTLFKSKSEKYELWKLQYSSFEACPYYYGSHVFLTYLKDDNVINTYEIAHSTNAGDPPMLYSSKINAHIKSDSVFLNIKTKNQEAEDKIDSTQLNKLLRIK